ncbi:MAG: hypothetical protein R2789_06255 [Microthrixaceae bacterium]
MDSLAARGSTSSAPTTRTPFAYRLVRRPHGAVPGPRGRRQRDPVAHRRSVDRELPAKRAGYRTALLGKAHFEPAFDPEGRWEENRRWQNGETGSWRGFDRSIQAVHIAAFNGTPVSHYGRWLAEEHPEHLDSFAGLLGAGAGGDTGAPETKNNPIPTEWYHTDWVADLVTSQLDEYSDDDDWFIWMSVPRPSPSMGSAGQELGRVPWQDLDLPAGHPGSDEAIRAGPQAGTLARLLRRPSATPRGDPRRCRSSLTHDQIREINAKVHVMNEARSTRRAATMLAHLDSLGWTDDTDVFFTTDHGELQGDYGLLYKGPYHTDSLMRLPLVWAPARSAGVRTDGRDRSGGPDRPRSDLLLRSPVWRFPTGARALLPTAPGSGSERVLCEWDSQFPGWGMHLRTIYRDGWICTAYERSTAGEPNGLEKSAIANALFGDALLAPIDIRYDGTEGELYNVEEDPHQWWNLSGTIRTGRYDDLVADLYASLSDDVRHLDVEAPA